MAAPTTLLATIDGVDFGDLLTEDDEYLATFSAPVRRVNVARPIDGAGAIQFSLNRAETGTTGDFITKPTVASNHMSPRGFSPIERVAFRAGADEYWGDTISIVGVV